MKQRSYYIDLAERAAWTFVQGFASFWIVTGDIDSATLVGGLVAGALSVAKSIVAGQIGDRDSAALLPSNVVDKESDNG